jgi:excisionase family DNA binding protein
LGSVRGVTVTPCCAFDNKGDIKMAVQLLRLEEVAERLSLNLHTIRVWASQRRLPIVKIGGAVRVKESDLEELIESRRVEPKPRRAV